MSIKPVKTPDPRAQLRLIQAISEFEVQLSSRAKLAYREDRQKFTMNSPSVDDVKRLAAELRADWGCPSLGPRAIDSMSRLRELTKWTDFSAPLWTMLRLALLASAADALTLEIVSDFLESIGQKLPPNVGIPSTQLGSSYFLNAIAELFIVIVELCKCILKSQIKFNPGETVQPLNKADLEGYRTKLHSWSSIICHGISVSLTASANKEAAEKAQRLQYEARAMTKSQAEFLDACSIYDVQSDLKSVCKEGISTITRAESLYLEWLDAYGPPTLVINGKFGSGKSVLLANIINTDLLTRTRDIVSYFFCRYDRYQSLTARTVVGSLARQLLSQRMDFMESNLVLDDTPNIADLMKYLRYAFPRTRTVWFVLDGIEAMARSEALQVLETLQKLQQWFRLKLIISARPEFNSLLRSTFLRSIFLRYGMTKLRIPEKNNNDINYYISERLYQFQKSNETNFPDSETLAKIRDNLIQQAHGTFLWVTTQIEALRRAGTHRDLVETLDKIPHQLREIYNHALTHTEHKTGRGLRMLQLMTQFARSVSVQEVLQAFQIETDPTEPYHGTNIPSEIYELCISCSGLVTIDESEMTVNLIHPSVLQFLTAEQARLFNDSTKQNTENQSGTGTLSKEYLIFSSDSQQTTKITSESSVPPVMTDELELDIESIYSTDTTASTVLKQTQMKMLAEEMSTRIKAVDGWEANFSLLKPKLPDLLKAFACQLGDESISKEHVDAMVFVRKHRTRIANVVTGLVETSSSAEGSYGQKPMERPAMPVPEENFHDKILRWQNPDGANEDYELQQVSSNPEIFDQHLDDIVDSTSDRSKGKGEEEEAAADDDDGDGDDDDDVSSHDSKNHEETKEPYSRIVRESLEFQWLSDKIVREMKYQCHSIDSMSDIAKQILNLQPQRGKVHRHSLQPLHVTFLIDWPKEYLIRSIEMLRSRGFGEDELISPDTIENAFVLVGSSMDAMASTIAEYFQDIWSKRGVELLALLHQALREPKGEAHGQLQGKTTTSIKVNGDKLEICCEGGIYAILEIAQMLGWLSSILQPAEQGCGATRQTSSLIKMSSSTQMSSITNTPITFATYRFSRRTYEIESQPNGQCWYAMFEDVSITDGFPILRRPNGCHGLEMTLEGIARLLRTDQTVIRNGSLTIRHHSHALVPSGQNGDLISWHYLHSSNSARLPYCKVPLYDVNLRMPDLLNSRHIIGWCSKATTIAGAYGNHYQILQSGLSSPSSTLLLESISLSGGYFANLSVPIKFGVQRPALHVRPNAFATQIEAMSERYVLLWDDSEKRGWLIDGLSALLHLLRTSLYVLGSGRMKSAVSFKEAMLTEPSGNYPDAAIDFFFKDGTLHPNMKLQIYPGATKDDAYFVHQRVSDLCRVLEEAYDQQYKLLNAAGKTVKWPLKTLVGWDFVHVATNRSIFEPCSANLGFQGPAWADLLRDIQAVTLFGRNFGEIIKPDIAISHCAHWSTLPQKQHYIAAHNSTITAIVNRWEDKLCEPLRLTQNLVLDASSAFSRLCVCGKTPNEHSNFASGIMSRKARKGKGKEKNSEISLPDNGAIVFGHNRRSELPSLDAQHDSEASLSGRVSQHTAPSAELSPSTTPTSISTDGQRSSHRERVVAFLTRIRAPHRPQSKSPIAR